MIRLASWNIRGLNVPHKYREVGKVIVDHHWNFICLVENKARWINVDKIKRKGLLHWDFVHNCPINSVGSVWVAWDPNVFWVSLICSTLQTITFLV